MSYIEYIKKWKEIQNKLLVFLDDDNDREEKYQNLVDILSNQNFKENQHDFISFLHLINYISKYHYRGKEFLNKIEQLFKYLNDSFSNDFSNLTIFNIFKSNKAILLILIEQKILTINNSIANIMNSSKYRKKQYNKYFLPEIASFLKKEEIQKIVESYFSNENNEEEETDQENEEEETDKENDEEETEKENEEEIGNSRNESDNENDDNNKDQMISNSSSKNQNIIIKLPDNFMEHRKTGENENEICKIIRDDMIEDFIVYLNKYEYSINSNIKSSIYETHSYLIKNKLTLIEYAAFFGSAQIFKYLLLNKADITNSLWLYGINGNNPEIIQLLEENSTSIIDTAYDECFEESIKCHHNDMAYYIQNNYINSETDINENFDFEDNVFLYGFNYYNYNFFPSELNNYFFVFYLCKYGYYTLVESMIKNKMLNLNGTAINF